MSGIKVIFFAFIHSPLLIWYVICLHVLWGIMLVFYPTITPPLVLLGGFQHLLDAIGPSFAGTLILVLAVLAAIGLIFHRRIGYWLSFWLLIPQYSVAMFAALSSLEAIITGITVKSMACNVTFMTPWQQTVLGTTPVIISGTMHTIAILARFLDKKVLNQTDYLRSENSRLRRRLVENGLSTW